MHILEFRVKYVPEQREPTNTITECGNAGVKRIDNEMQSKRDTAVALKKRALDVAIACFNFENQSA